jgi:hypothetical protein
MITCFHRTDAAPAATARQIGSVLCLAALLAGLPAQAEWSGALGLASDNIDRSMSQSDRSASASASLAWRHASGVGASLGVSSVSQAQFVGSDGYKLVPEVGWSGDVGPPGAWRAGLFLRGQVFPGARGPWFGSLPPPAQGRTVQATDSDYSTAEVGASLGWKVATLSVTRSITDYLGLAATETGPLGDRVVESKGTTYVGLDVDWPVNDAVSVSAGVGRLAVPNFEGLGYTDWRVGAAARAWGVRFGLQASGSNANSSRYGLRSRSAAGGSATAGTALVASAAWLF